MAYAEKAYLKYRQPDTNVIKTLTGHGDTLGHARSMLQHKAGLTVGTLIGGINYSAKVADITPYPTGGNAGHFEDAVLVFAKFDGNGNLTDSITRNIKNMSTLYADPADPGKVATHADIQALAAAIVDANGNGGFSFLAGRYVD